MFDDKKRGPDKENADPKNFANRIWAIVETIKPYNRAVLESMTKEERRSYNVGYGVLGVLFFIAGILFMIFPGTDDSGFCFLVALGLLIYYWNPFFYANIWGVVKKVAGLFHW